METDRREFVFGGITSYAAANIDTSPGKYLVEGRYHSLALGHPNFSDLKILGPWRVYAIPTMHVCLVWGNGCWSECYICRDEYVEPESEMLFNLRHLLIRARDSKLDCGKPLLIEGFYHPSPLKVFRGEQEDFVQLCLDGPEE